MSEGRLSVVIVCVCVFTLGTISIALRLERYTVAMIREVRSHSPAITLAPSPPPRCCTAVAGGREEG